VSEYYVAARENRSGNKNTGDIFLIVDTQSQRAAAFENRLRSLVRQPYVVGAHWFRYADEPTHGRPKDGEDYNFGLVDIDNRPYDELTAAMTRLHADVPRLHRQSGAAEQAAGPIPIPLVRAEMSELRKQLGNLRSLGTMDESLQLYELLAAWSADKLYFVVLVSHVSQREIYSASPPMNPHELELTIASPSLDEPIRVRFGSLGGTSADVAEVECHLVAKGLRQTLAVAIPASIVGKSGFEENQQFEFKLRLDDMLDKQSTAWEGRLILAGKSQEAGREAQTKSAIPPRRPASR
jgi:hypothetical protein